MGTLIPEYNVPNDLTMSKSADQTTPTTRVSTRFKSLRLAKNEVVIYDTKVDEGWIQSDTVYELPSLEG